MKNLVRKLFILLKKITINHELKRLFGKNKIIKGGYGMGDYDGDLDRLEYEIKGTGTRTNYAYDFDNNTWYNDNYRTITINETQEVDKTSTIGLYKTHS